MTHRLPSGSDQSPPIIRTRDDIERALDAGELFGLMNDDRFWRLRRNGRTQAWKRDPSRFRIPVKAGLRAYGAITEDNMRPYGLDRTYFRHVSELVESRS